MHAVEEKIKKLLALAENVPDTPEGITAAKIALKLMKEHAVKVSLDGGIDDPITFRVVPTEHRLLMWRRSLAEVVAQHCSCRSLLVGGKLRIYGHIHDVEAALYLLDLLETQVVSEGWTYADSLLDVPGKYATVDRFLRAAILRIRNRLVELTHAESPVDDKGGQLMALRDLAVDAHIRAQYEVANRDYAVEGSAAGYAAGGRVRLGLTEVEG